MGSSDSKRNSLASEKAVLDDSFLGVFDLPCLRVLQREGISVSYPILRHGFIHSFKRNSLRFLVLMTIHDRPMSTHNIRLSVVASGLLFTF